MINLQKHYDKLTAPERFAASIAAAIREDETERRALIDSAPKVNFEFPHTIGLHEGFRDLTKHHVIQQLGTAGSFWMLTYVSQNDAERVQVLGEEIPTGETALELAARRFMEGLEAFDAVCKEYNIDPAAMNDAYNPYPILTGMVEIIIRRAFQMSNTELIDLEETKAAYRKVIETSREHWQEARAR